MLTCVLTSAACCCLASRARAQNAAGRDSASALAEGRRHFQLAGEHYRAGRFREALHELRVADSQVPSPELWFNMARALEQLGENDEAIAEYQRYMEARPDAADASEVSAKIAALEALSSHEQARTIDSRAGIRIDADAAGTRVMLDGKPIGQAPIESIQWVEPGMHVLEAERAGHAPFRAALTAPARSMVVGAIAMEPLSSVTSGASDGRSDRGASIAAWLAGAAAAAALVVSTAARVSAESDRSAGDLGAAYSANRVADVTLAATLASSAAAAIFYLAGSR